MYATYHILAKELGLRLSPEPGMMTFSFDVYGDLDGYPVNLRRLCGRGARIDITCALRPHLDLGFGFTRSGVVSKVAAWLGKQDIQVGDPGFDRAFNIRGDEPERVRALLTPQVRQVLASATAPDFELSDAEYSMGYGLQLTNETSVRMAEELREAVRMAQVLGEASTHVPCASALRAHHDVWMAYVRAHEGFQAGATPLWMRGKLENTWVLARASRNRENDFSLELSARLEHPISIQLKIEPQRHVLDSLAGGADQETGDARFDDVFDVTRTTRIDLVNEELRGRLLELSRLGPVTLFDSQLTVHTPASLDPAQVPVVLQDLRATLAVLDRSARSSDAAYR